MFGQLADPHGANNALSQVLYGLALRLVVVSIMHHDLSKREGVIAIVAS